MPKENKPLLSRFIKKPSLLLWLAVIPQVLLILHNCRIVWLISSEASSENLSIFGILYAGQISLLALTAGAWYSGWKQKKPIQWPWLLVLLIGQIGYLWFFTTNLWRIIPANVDRWIVNEGMISFYAFTLMMPGIFYAGARLACFELPISRLKDFGLSILLAIIAPAIFYFIFIATSLVTRGTGKYFYMIIWPLFFIVLTVFMFVGLVRLMVLAYNWISERGSLGQMLFAIAIGIAGPIGGLSVNSFIPFPADFQSVAVYVMAIVNGVIVLLPRIKKYSGALLFLRSSTYPFTLYFFLVFLPFLPISLIAIFALGSGFLILVPVLLFMLHTKKLADDFSDCAKAIGAKAIALVVLGVTILPGYFLWQAASDKNAISQALQYVYSPNYEIKQNFSGDLKSTRRALLNLKRFKDGLQLPYISDVYNRIVFEGMVLPDEKIAHMFYLFTGEDIKSSTRGGFGLQRGPGIFFDVSRRSRNMMRRGPRRRIDRNVSLESVQSQPTNYGNYNRAKVHLTMRNTGASSEAEFLTNINVPKGTVVTAFRLKVNGEIASGKIFERRTAQWVYHMIRDFVRRDPGLLFYKTPGQLELRIYPFNSGEVREAEIEFEFPENLSPAVTIGTKTVELFQAQTPINKIISAHDKNGNVFLFLPEAQLELLPTVKRQPYLYFILDRSKNGLQDLSLYAKYIKAIVAQYPEVKTCRFTAANFSSQDLPDWVETHDEEAISAALGRIKLSRQGGLDLERVIKAELLRYARNFSNTVDDRELQIYPLFVVLTPDETKIHEMSELDFYRDLVPESGYYLVASGLRDAKRRFLWERQDEVEAPAEVSILAIGKQRAVVAAGAFKSAVAYFPALKEGKAPDEEFLAFDSQENKFVTIGKVESISLPNEFIDKISLLYEDSRIILNPSQKDALLPGLVKESRAKSVLIPSASFIVVERGVQWKALQINEKQRLGTSSAFEFEEDFKTPAPSLWVLLICIAMLALISQFLRRIRAAGPDGHYLHFVRKNLNIETKSKQL